MLNQIAIAGRMTKDPEYRMTQNQKPVTSFTLAVDRDYVPKGEERGCDFIPCVVFGNGADFVHNNFTKGRMAIVVGRLQLRTWEDKDGNKRTSAEVLADRVYFGGDGKREEKKSGFDELNASDGDLPF